MPNLVLAHTKPVLHYWIHLPNSPSLKGSWKQEWLESALGWKISLSQWWSNLAELIQEWCNKKEQKQCEPLKKIWSGKKPFQSWFADFPWLPQNSWDCSSLFTHWWMGSVCSQPPLLQYTHYYGGGPKSPSLWTPWSPRSLGGLALDPLSPLCLLSSWQAARAAATPLPLLSLKSQFYRLRRDQMTVFSCLLHSWKPGSGAPVGSPEAWVYLGWQRLNLPSCFYHPP